MRLWVRAWCASMVWLIWSGAPLAAPGTADLASQRSAAEQQRTDLRARIQTLQKELDAREAVRKEAADALKASEVAISQTTRRLNELATQLKTARAELESLKKQIVRQQTTLTQRRDELSDQLRRQYASGLSPWTALLSVGDPQELSRNLAYLDYVSQARAKAVADLAAEQAAHAATKAGVDGLASAKAQQILAGAGHRPVAVDASAANGGAGDIIAAIQGAADPFTRTKLFRQNREQLRKQRN